MKMVDIDPVLTTHARGYQHQARVGRLLFPEVEVRSGSGQVLEFGTESFKLYNARRAPGAATKRIEFGFEGKRFDLVSDSLEGKVPREFARDAGLKAGVDLGLRSVNNVMNSLTLNLEYEQAAVATTAANFDANHKLTLAGTSQWTHASGKPVDDIEGARHAIRASCGMYPNIGVFGPKAYAGLKNNAQVIGRFQNTDLITSAMLASLLELDQLVEGKAVYSSDTAAGFQDVWGDFAVLAYAPQKPAGFEEPSFGYTYTLTGHPFVEKPYWDGNAKSTIYGVTYERAPVLTSAVAGFLFIDTAI